MKTAFYLLLLVAVTLQDITSPVVSIGEYPSNSIATFNKGNMVVRWKNLMIQNKPAIEFAIVTKSTGYSSIAFNPSDKGMKNLDCYFGYMKSGNLVVADMWVNGLVEPKLDTAQGGKDSILAKNGGIANGEFTWKFQRFIDTGDLKDSILLNGSNKFVVALHSSSTNLATTHNFKLYGTGFNFLDATATVPDVFEPVELFPFHYIVLPSVFVAIAAVAVATTILPFVHLISPFDMIFQQKILPPIPFLIAENLNEISGLSIGEITLILCYFILNIVWFVASTFNAVAFNVDPWSILGRVFGSMNLLNFTFVLLPIARNSIWTLIFGIPFERAIKYHKWISIWAYICMCLHFIFICIYNGVRETPTYPWSTNYTSGLAGVYGAGEYGFVFMGFISWIFFTLLILVTWIRRSFWNLFAYSHLILAVLSIIFASIHHYYCIFHLLPSIFLYTIDYTIRKIMFLIPAEVESIKPMAGGITKLEIKSLLARFAQPGQYVFIYFPQASLIGRNPFSISSKTGKDTFTIHVKSMTGRGIWEGLPTFTSTLNSVAKKCESGETKPYFIRIEGPYGRPSIRFEKYKILLLASGGIGATPNVSILQNLANKIKQGKLQHIEKIYFVWSTRSIESIEWFREIFELVRYEPQINCMLYVTCDKRLIPKERPDNDIKFIEGRPNYKDIMEDIQSSHPKVRYFGCCACGTLPMVSSVETLCWINSLNPIKRQWHFHKESFLL